MPISDLLTTAQVADRLGVPRRTITRWARDGKLRIADRLPGETGAMLFRPADVEALLSKPEPSEAA